MTDRDPPGSSHTPSSPSSLSMRASSESTGAVGQASLDRDEFLAGYLAEADEHVQASIGRLLAVEKAIERNEPHHRLVRDLFRSLHTLKGLSAMVGVEPVVELAHEMEEVLRRKDRSTGRLDARLVDVLLQGVRAIEERVAAFVRDRNAVPAAPRAILEALADESARSDENVAASAASIALDADILAKLSATEVAEIAAAFQTGRRAFRVDFAPNAERASSGVTITSVRERVASIADIVKVVPRSPAGALVFTLIVTTTADKSALATHASTTIENVTPIEPLPSPTIAREEDDVDAMEARSIPTQGFIRVEVKRLDDSLEKLASLIVTRFRLVRAIDDLKQRGVDTRDLAVIAADAGRQLVALRDSITRARMVSVAELLERVPLIVRGMSRSTGKAVRLQVDAGRAELDKAVAERVFPAIVHLVRNAVDHAIETPDERRRLGKPVEGTITVSCFEHSDSQLELIVRDDGKGIDAAAVAARAQRPVPASADGLLELLTLPGLSTAATTTTTSGRGMGMDIVKRIAVDTLGGELLLETRPGLGTSFILRVPLSVSILDSFSFVCASQAFVVPVASVEEIVDLGACEVFRAPTGLPSSSARKRSAPRLLKRRGAVVPLFDLGALIDDDAVDEAQRKKALVVRRRGEVLAFAVDRMLGKQEIVVRPLEDPLVKRAGIAGTTDLGDGRPTLVLDLIGLTQAGGFA